MFHMTTPTLINSPNNLELTLVYSSRESAVKLLFIVWVEY